MTNRIHLLMSFCLISILVLTACGSKQTPEGVGVSEGSVEASLATYSDTAQGFSVGYPNNWTQDTAFTNGVRFAGGDSYMTLEFVTATTGTDILGYNATGTSTITSKTFTAHDERYYMPLADGRIAIQTVVTPGNLYDQQGVRDIALTFKLTK